MLSIFNEDMLLLASSILLCRLWEKIKHHFKQWVVRFKVCVIYLNEGRPSPSGSQSSSTFPVEKCDTSLITLLMRMTMGLSSFTKPYFG